LAYSNNGNHRVGVAGNYFLGFFLAGRFVAELFAAVFFLAD
jgi:hypothetical protein